MIHSLNHCPPLTDISRAHVRVAIGHKPHLHDNAQRISTILCPLLHDVNNGLARRCHDAEVVVRDTEAALHVTDLNG